MPFARTSNNPFHHAKQALLDGIQSCKPTTIGIQATDEDYAVLKAYIREVAEVLDLWGNAVLHEAKVRAPRFGGSDTLGPVFSQMINDPFGLLEQLDTLQEGARAHEKEEARFAEGYSARQRFIEAVE